MEFVRFFCIVLAGSLLLVSSSFAQSTEDDKKDTTNSESTPKVESTLTPSTTPTTEKLITTIATESSSEKAPSTTEKNTVEQSTVTSPTESSSAEPSTTTHVPSTSTTPAPPKFTWKVHENDPNKTVCLIVQVELSFKDFNNPETVTVPTEAAIDVDKSSCGNDTQVLALKINDTYSLELTFEKEEIEKEAPKFYLQSLTFTNGTETFTLNGTINKDYMVGHLNKSFKCIDEETHDLTRDSAPANKSVTWKDVRVQAFMSKNNNGDFDTAEECNQDGTSDVVPIAVGCALAGLVVVVLIAYLVGRRRSRQKGYQSV